MSGARDTPALWAMKPNTYYFPSSQGTSVTTTPAANLLKTSELIAPAGLALARIGLEVTTAGDAGCVIRLGIYADDGSGAPGLLVAEFGTIPGDVVAVAEIAVAQNLPPGLFHMASVSQLCPVNAPTVRGASTATVLPLIGSAVIPAAGAAFSSYSVAGVAGAMPADITGIAVVNIARNRFFIRTA